jgi:transposase
MVDHIVDASGPRGRVEIRNGVGRRRRWSDEEKGRIVAESFAPGAVVSEVARRHEMSPQHLFAWRKTARDGQLALPVDGAAMFVPVMMTAQKAIAARPSAPSITIETAGVVVRAECGVDPGWLADVLRAVKGLS